jgi:CRP-like cAMP-binding protein
MTVVLRQHPFLAELSPLHMEELAGCATNVHAPEGSFLIREGEIANTFYLVRTGRIVLEMEVPPRGSLRIQTVGPGEILGWSWLISPYRWHFSARASADVRAIALDGGCLRKKCSEDHDFGYEILERLARVMERRLEATRMQLLDMYGTAAEVRG